MDIEDIPEIEAEEIKSATEFANTKYDSAKFNEIAGNKVWGVDKYNVGSLTESLKEYSDNDPNATSAYSARTYDSFKKDFELIKPSNNLQASSVNKTIKHVKMGNIKLAEKSIKPAINYLIKNNCKKIILGCTELPIAIFAFRKSISSFNVW